MNSKEEFIKQIEENQKEVTPEEEELNRFRKLRDNILETEQKDNPDGGIMKVEINGKLYWCSKTALDEFYGKYKKK